MTSEELEGLLADVAAGRVDAKAATQRLQASATGRTEQLGFATLDHDRAARRGFPEVIYGPGKTPEQLLEIFGRLAARNPNVLSTRTDPAAAKLVLEAIDDAQYDETSRVLRLHRDLETRGLGSIAVVAAGTSDQGPALEAEICARVMGNEVQRYTDVGVAGLHRLLDRIDEIRRARVIICVAGMEAALPSVVAGLVDRPVVAVPTSVGYGANFQGLSALLGSLTACAAGVTTVNIDNGFGAAYAATLMNRP